MSLKSKLKRVEKALGEENKGQGPIMVILYKDETEEELFKQFREQYPEDYTPRIVLKVRMTREEARKSGGLLSPDFPNNLVKN